MKKICAVLFVGFLSACATSDPLPIEPIPEITFKHLKPMIVNVADIEIEDRTERKEGVNYVGQRFPTPPKRALENWVRDRLRADGQSGVARVVIFEASGVEETLEKTSGLKGFITDDQSEKYTATMDVRLEINPQNGQAPVFVNTSVKRHTTIVESATLQERELIWFELVEQMMTDFDNRMSQNMNAQLFSR